MQRSTILYTTVRVSVRENLAQSGRAMVLVEQRCPECVGLVVQVGWVLPHVCSCNRCDVSCVCRASMPRPAQYTDVVIGLCQWCVCVCWIVHTEQHIHYKCSVVQFALAILALIAGEAPPGDWKRE